MSFADHRNVDNIMDEQPHSAVAMDGDADHDAAHKAPLLSSVAFDFQQYKYKSLSLAQHIVVYLRLKVRQSASASSIFHHSLAPLRQRISQHGVSQFFLQALLTFRNKITMTMALVLGCGFIVFGSVFPVRTSHVTRSLIP